MEVKAGYKQTEIGLIPEDWDVKSLDTISFVTSGKRLPLGKSLVDSETPHPYIRVTDMRMGTVSMSDLKFVPDDVFPAIKRYRIYKDDIFISVAGTLGIVGKIPLELDGANLTENADRITNITCSRDYLLHFLMSPVIQNTIEAIQTVGAQPKLALTRIRKFDIPVPPTLAEQEAIAEALSDADALIEALEQLLTKKRQVKQGAMQELLTGKRRLPGFSGEWEVKTIGEIGNKFLNGGTPSTKKVEYWEGTIPWITGADIVDQKVVDLVRRFITDEAVKNSSTNVVEKGNLLVVTRTGVGKIAIAPYDLAISQDLTGIYVKKEYVLPEFLYWYFSYDTSSLRNLNQGTSIAGITRDTLTSLSVLLPSIPEQTAIAEILSDMDAEIAALEGKLPKARQVKAGMMSELLTGKIRLV